MKTRGNLMRRNILTGRRPTKKRVPKGGAKRASAMPASLGPASLGPASLGPASLVPTFLHMLNTVKLYHWKTTSFSTHKATDELYSKLNEKIDEFVEVMLGKREMGGRAKLLNVSLIKLSVYSNNDAFKKQNEMYKDFLMAFNESLGVDLLAIRDEILAAFNQFLYLLSLN